MTTHVKAIPDGMHTVTPHLLCAGAADAIAFYKKAFDATEKSRLPGPNGKLMHAAILGFVVSQIRVPPDEHDPQLSKVIRENAIAAIVTDGSQPSPASGLPGRAVALREAVLGDDADGALTPAEKTMMAEWLDRLADQHG